MQNGTLTYTGNHMGHPFVSLVRMKKYIDYGYTPSAKDVMAVLTDAFSNGVQGVFDELRSLKARGSVRNY